MIETYTTEDGLVLKLKRVTQVLLNAVSVRVKQEWANGGEPVEIPTFTVTEGKADSQTFQHRVTEKGNTLDIKDDPEQTRINRIMWDAHKDALERLTSAQQEAQVQAMFMFGITCDFPEEGEWTAQLKFAGLEVPEDPIEKRFAYLWYCALSVYDKKMLISILEVLSLGKMVKPEQMSLFRRRAASAMDGIAEGIFDEAFDALDEAADSRRELDGEPELSGGEDGEGVEDPVG